MSLPCARINLAPRRKVCQRLPWYITLVLSPVHLVLMAMDLTAFVIDRYPKMWSDLWREAWMAWRAWHELAALDGFLTAHCGPSLNRAAAHHWAWVDDRTRWELSWRPAAHRSQPSTIALTATGPSDLMTLKLDTDRDGAPIMRSDWQDHERCQAWALDVAQPIVREIFAQTAALPLLSVEARTATVRVPITLPLKPLIGALELFLTAVPQARRTD